ncbi:MAG: hypothetical protein HY719_12910 [Planctomycetes bacterium]|nr:hypothetical protein [Planctomycetota bacterium]
MVQPLLASYAHQQFRALAAEAGRIQAPAATAATAAALAPVEPEPFSFDVRLRDPVEVTPETTGARRLSDRGAGVTLVSGPLNVGISGEGYFRLTDDAGNEYLTRTGAFTVGRDGRLLSVAGGLSLDPEVRVPADTVKVAIAEDGSVLGTNRAGRTTMLGTISLVNPDAADLRDAGGGDMLVDYNQRGGTRRLGAPGGSGFGGLTAASTSLQPASGMLANPVAGAVSNFASRVTFTPSADLPASFRLSLIS